MSTIEDEARAEAEKRWPGSWTHAAIRQGFEAGAEWAASRPVTDAEVIAALNAHWGTAASEFGSVVGMRAALESVRPTEGKVDVEDDDTAWRLSLFLDEVTGGLLSKSTYPVAVMVRATDERYARLRNEAVSEALSDTEGNPT